MLLFLTRHGETKWNRLGKTQGIQDTSLTDLGRQQAEKLAQRLKASKASIDTIYCSNLYRAKETAEIIGERLKINPIPNQLLNEVSFGNWEGLTLREIEKQYPGQLARWRNELTFSPKEGESLISVNNRVGFFIEELKDKCQKDNDNVLIVSHAAITKVLILRMIGIPLNLLAKFKISQAGLSLLRVEDDNNSILFLNETHHLEI